MRDTPSHRSDNANGSDEPGSICPVYWHTVIADHDRRARRAAIRVAAFRRLRGRRRKLEPWQFSLGRMFLVVTALCLLLAGRHGRDIRKSRVPCLSQSVRQRIGQRFGSGFNITIKSSRETRGIRERWAWRKPSLMSRMRNAFDPASDW